MSQTTSGERFGERSVSERIIEAVAERTGREPTEVGPLYHVIDPDALDRLFSPTGGSLRSQGHVQFTFAGCDVVVHGDGEVEVGERDVLSGMGDAADEASVAAADRDETA